MLSSFTAATDRQWRFMFQQTVIRNAGKKETMSICSVFYDTEKKISSCFVLKGILILVGL